MRDQGRRSGLMTLSLVALLTLGLFAVTAAGCSGSKLGAFEIYKLDEGRTFAEAEAYVESERKRIADGLVVVGSRPIWMTQGERAQLEPGQTGMLVSTVTPGTWVLWCLQEHPPTAFFVMPALELT